MAGSQTGDSDQLLWQVRLLNAAGEPVDFRARTVDVAIRYGRGSFPGLKAEELFRDEFAQPARWPARTR